MNFALVILSVFLLNLPFGYWRASVRKFSLQWALAIHIPVPLVVLMRVYSGVGFAWWTFPLTIAAFFLGQFAGARIRGMRAA